jgi:hypothetical protein
MDPVRVQRRARGSARGIGRGRRGHRTRRGTAPCLPAPRRAARRSPRRGVHVFQTGSAQRARWNVVRLRRSTDFLCKNAHVFPFFFSTTARGSGASHMDKFNVRQGLHGRVACRPPPGAGPIQPNRYPKPEAGGLQPRLKPPTHFAPSTTPKLTCSPAAAVREPSPGPPRHSI